MRKVINNPSDFVKETVEGLCLAHPSYLKTLNGDFRNIIRANKKEDKVAIVTAGGSGHLPVFLGYVGKGLLDACSIGDVFASPSASKMSDVIKYVDNGKGVLCLYGNYGGDKMNFAMACEEVDFDDIETREVLVCDDIASHEDPTKRRGVAGMVYAFKIAGAAAELDYTLDEVVNVTNKALNNLRTMGIALSPCVVPSVGKPTFSVPEGQMEVGMGIHGEAGIEVCSIKSADEIAKLLLEKIETEIKLSNGDKVSIMVNGLGSTPLEEQYLIYRYVANTLSDKGVECIFPHVGEYATSMEMAGLSLTVFKLDDELEKLMNYEAVTPFYTNYNI